MRGLEASFDATVSLGLTHPAPSSHAYGSSQLTPPTCLRLQRRQGGHYLDPYTKPRKSPLPIFRRRRLMSSVRSYNQLVTSLLSTVRHKGAGGTRNQETTSTLKLVFTMYGK